MRARGGQVAAAEGEKGGDLVGRCRPPYGACSRRRGRVAGGGSLASFEPQDSIAEGTAMMTGCWGTAGVGRQGRSAGREPSLIERGGQPHSASFKGSPASLKRQGGSAGRERSLIQDKARVTIGRIGRHRGLLFFCVHVCPLPQVVVRS